MIACCTEYGSETRRGTLAEVDAEHATLEAATIGLVDLVEDVEIRERRLAVREADELLVVLACFASLIAGTFSLLT